MFLMILFNLIDRSLLYDPSNDYSIDYTNWYDDYNLIFNKLLSLSDKINLSKGIVSQVVEKILRYGLNLY